MSLILRTSLVGNSGGTTVSFTDITGQGTAAYPYGYNYGDNVAWDDLVNVRFKFGTATTLTTSSTLVGDDGDEFSIYVEYIKTVGSSSTVNGKTMTVGAIFVPQESDIAVPAGDEWETTGFFNPYISAATYLPTDTETPHVFGLDDFNQSLNTYFEDNLYQVEYEIYSTSRTSNFTTTSGVTYLVGGTVGQFVTYLASNYYVGEIFTATDASGVTSVAANSYCTDLTASCTSYAFLLYQVESDVNEIIISSAGVVSNPTLNIPAQIAVIRTYIETMQSVCNAGNVPYVQAQQMLIYVQALISQLQLLLN